MLTGRFNIGNNSKQLFGNVTNVDELLAPSSPLQLADERG